MHERVVVRRHRAELNLIHGLVQERLLSSRSELPEVRKIHVRATALNVFDDHPIRRRDLVVPTQIRFVGVTVVTRISENPLHLGRRYKVGNDRRIVQRRMDKLDGNEEREADADSNARETTKATHARF
jgi:hypothetical protein